MKRNLKKALANYSSELIGKFWTKKNTGAYGTVALPSADQAISLRGDSSVAISINDEASNAKAQGRVRTASTRMRGEAKLNLNADLDASGDVTKEWSIGSWLEAILGKRTVVASATNATASITDPTSVKAGLSVTGAGSLVGQAGNYVSIKLVNAGPTGSASLNASASPDFVLSYYNDSTVEDVVDAIDAHANLASVEDANGTDTTDLFKDLLANCGIISGEKLYLSGSAPAGHQYDNSEAPQKDHTAVYNKEKIGYVISGIAYDKLSIEMADKAPMVKVEGNGRYAKIVGVATATASVVATNKVYISDEKQFGDFDTDAPQYLDIVDNDGITRKATGLKLTGKGFDTAWYVTTDSNFSCDTGDYVAFHEPTYWNPDINPINGLGGSLKIDNELFTEIKSIKVDYENNYQLLNNLALQKTMSGFIPSKYITGKITVSMLVRTDKMGIIQKLHGSDVVQVPVEIVLGTVAGEKMTIFARFVEFKAPDLSDKGEEVQEVNLEGNLVFVLDGNNVPSLVIQTH